MADGMLGISNRHVNGTSNLLEYFIDSSASTVLTRVSRKFSLGIHHIEQQLTVNIAKNIIGKTAFSRFGRSGKIRHNIIPAKKHEVAT